MTKQLLLEGRDWSNDIKKSVRNISIHPRYQHSLQTEIFDRINVIFNPIYNEMFMLVYMYIHEPISFFFFCFKLFSRKMSHSLSYKEDKCVSKTCPTSKNTKRGLIRNTTKDCNIQEYLITMNLKTKQPSGKFYETFWGQNFRLFSFTKQVCLFISYFSLIFKIL